MVMIHSDAHGRETASAILTFEMKTALAALTLNRPEKFNALNNNR